MRNCKWLLAVVLTALALLATSNTNPVVGGITAAVVGGDVATSTPPSSGPDLRTALLPPASLEGNTLEPNYTGCGGIASPVINAAYEQEVVERVNAVRAAHQLPPLKRVSLVDDAARYHATDMGQDNYFDHDSYDRNGGALVYVCGWSSRIRSYYPNSAPLGENIAAGYPTPESVMNAWMNSTGHRENILRDSYWEIGVGYYAGSGSYSRYWVQDFGRRSNVFPLVINREAATTDSRHVSLFIYGDWQEIRLRNEDGVWTDWQPFQSTMDWTLHWSRGERTAWAEMRSGSQTVTSSDTIYLTSGFPALGNLPDTLWFTYSMVDERLSPAAHKVSPENIGSDDILTWSVTTDGDWFTVNPLNGATSDPFWITLTTFNKHQVAIYTGTSMVTVSDPSETENSPQQIDLILRVMDEPFRYTHLPLILNGSTPAN
jgi:uncharacterized protein YkwD